MTCGTSLENDPRWSGLVCQCYIEELVLVWSRVIYCIVVGSVTGLVSVIYQSCFWFVLSVSYRGAGSVSGLVCQCHIEQLVSGLVCQCNIEELVLFLVCFVSVI